ncbi:MULTISPECIES: NlpC/P60 family protein [Streptomyces]|uniref:NlpC/P60 family protein n=1 Tax=Streptomyces TaxID=1883 RepID=UPI0015962807|nr:glycoside hydrolase [Streptomyces sp. CAI-17]
MRRTTLAAVALVCGITCVGGLASAGTAYAAPEPAPTTSAPATPGTPEEDAAEGEPATPTALEEVRKKIEKLYHRASVATDAYNAAEEKAERQAKEVARLERAVARGQDRLALLRHQAGATAREQYRSGGIPEGAQFLLSDDPRLFLDNANRFQRGQHAAKGLMSQLRTTQEQLEKDEAAASAEYKKLERHRASKAKAKKEIKKQIKAAEELESRLAAEELERLRKLEEEAQRRAQSAWVDSGILDAISGRASAAGKKALEYAAEQIGKPYSWGAEGPDSYDCSGLTSQAWASAGVPIPRTSQEQWRQLERVPIREMRPGDLIIYHDDASHVGMYVGDGKIVHAPRPGRQITLAGAGTMTILGVVRPDA